MSNWQSILLHSSRLLLIASRSLMVTAYFGSSQTHDVNEVSGLKTLNQELYIAAVTIPVCVLPMSCQV